MLGCDTVGETLERDRPIPEMRQNAWRDPLVEINDLAFSEAVLREKYFVQVRESDFLVPDPNRSRSHTQILTRVSGLMQRKSLRTNAHGQGSHLRVRKLFSNREN